MTIKEIQEKYNLSKDSFWEVRPNSNKWVLLHSACEQIAAIENITFAKPEVQITNHGICLIGEATKGDKTIWSVGEASDANVKMAGKYYWSMAEKRLKDRLVLKLINAFDVYSEEEAEEFKK